MQTRIWLTFLLLTQFAWAQNLTVGMIEKDPGVYPGYTLFAPMANTNTYLINNCGFAINAWASNRRPALSVYLKDNGNLVRTEVSSQGSFGFFAGGAGGRVVEYDWDNNLVWEYEYAGNDYLQHHDIEILPNGNILMVAWERKTQQEAELEGRDPMTLTDGQLWPLHIIEVEPILPDSGNIVWEWHAWDHLIQDFDSTKSNFGVVENHPELIDVNFFRNSGADWMHTNSIDYHPGFDQIVVSVLEWNEIWVIDHSTTTAQAASHSGGNSGKGGDLLYRWGNPMAYRGGTVYDRQLDSQHDAKWVLPGYPGEGNITIFDNAGGDFFNPYSTVDEIVPPVDSMGNYSMTGAQFGPAAPVWQYRDSVPQNFFAAFISGAERLPNGHTLICNGPQGTFFEVGPAGKRYWKYVNPVVPTGIISQGDPVPGSGGSGVNLVFRSEKYGEDFPGFIGKDMTPGSRIELNPDTTACDPTADLLAPQELAITLFPNPVVDRLSVEGLPSSPGTLFIRDIHGRLMRSVPYNSREIEIPVADLPAGTYLLQANRITFRKFIKTD